MKTNFEKLILTVSALLLTSGSVLQAQSDKVYLDSIRHHRTLISTVPSNGDLNPYGVVVATASVGKIQKNDVLVSNFNGLTNLQGTGTTIVNFNPSSKNLSTFATVPHNLAQCWYDNCHGYAEERMGDCG